MTPSQLDTAFKAIAARIDPAARYAGHRPLTGGVSAQIEAIKLISQDGQESEVVLRRHGAAEWKQLQADVTTMEFGLQTVLQGAGLAVAKPLLLDTSASLLPTPYLVMNMVPGSTEVDPEWLPEALIQMADFLLILHRLDVQSVAHLGLPADDDPVQGALQYIPDTPAYAGLRQVVAQWQTDPGKPTLLHGDFWPGNVLWQQRKLAAVIDWEDANIGPAVADLAACRGELMAIYGEAAMHTFTDRYLQSATEPMNDLEVWELYAGHAALASMGDWGLDPKVEATRRARTRQFVDQAAKRMLARQ